MSWKFTTQDIMNMEAELRVAGYKEKLPTADDVVRVYNIWIIASLRALPGGKTK